MSNIGNLNGGGVESKDRLVQPNQPGSQPEPNVSTSSPKPQPLPDEDTFSSASEFIAEPGDSTTTHVLGNAFHTKPGEETGVRLLGKNLSALPSLSQEAQSFLAKGFESRSSEPSSLAEMQAKAPALIAEFEIHQKEAMRVVDHFESVGIEGQPSLARSLQNRLEMPSLSLRLVAMEIQSEKSHPQPNTERLDDLRALRQYVQAKRLESESTAALLLLESPQGLAKLRHFEKEAQALTDKYGVAYKTLEPQLTRIKKDLGALLQNAPQSAQELQTFEKSYLALCAQAAPIEEKLAKHVQAQADVKVAIDTTLATYEQHIAQGSPMGKALKESGVVALLKTQQNVLNETFKASLDELVQLRESQVQVEAVGGELVLRQHIRPTLNVALERAGLSTVQEGDHRAFQTQVDALRKKLGVHKERLENTSAGQQAGVLLQEIETQDQVRAYLQRFGKSSQDDLGPLGQAGNVDALTAELSAKGLNIEAPSEGMSTTQALLSAARRYETCALLEVAGLGRPNLADAMAVEKTTEALGKVLELTPEEQAALETLEPTQRLEALVGKLSAQYEGAAQVAASILVGRLHVPPEKLDRSGFPVGAAIVAQLKRHVEGGVTSQNKTLFPITPLTPQEARELCGFLEQPPVLSAEPSAFVETVLTKMEALNRFSAQDVNDLESILYRHGKGDPLSFAQVKRMLSDVNLPASDRQSLAPLVQRGAAGLEPSELFKSLDVAGSSAKYVPQGNWDRRFVSLKDLRTMRGLVFANEALPDSALPLGLLRADMLINARKLDHHLSEDTEDFYSVRNAIKGAYADPYTRQERRLLNALYQKQPHAKGKSLHASVEDSFASGWFGSREFAAKRGELLNLIDRPSVEDWASRYEPGQLNANDTPYAFASRIAEYYGVDPKRPDQIVQASQASRSTGGSCLLYDDEIADAIEDWNDDGRSPRISKNQPSLADIERLYRNDYYEPSSARHKENFRLLKRSHDETQRALQQYFKASAAKDERAAQKHYDQAVKSYSEHWIVGRTYSASQSAYMDQYISNLEDGMTVARYTRDGAILIGTTIATAGAGTAVAGAGLFARTGIALSAGVGFGTATSLASRGVEEAGHAISGQGASWNRFAQGMGSDLKMVGQTAAFTAVPVGIYGKLGQMASGGSNFAKAAVQGVVGQRLTAAGMNTALDMGSHYVNKVFHPESAQAKGGYSAKRGLFVAGVGAVFGTTNFGLASRGSRTAQTADYVLDVVSVGIEGYGVEAVEGRAGQFDPQAALNILAVRLATRQKAVRDVGGSPGAKKTSVESTPVRDVVPPAARKNGWSDAVLDLAIAKGYTIDMGGRPPADLVFKAIENETRLDGGLKTKAEPTVETSKVFSTESVDADISALVALRGQRKNTQGKLNHLSKDALSGSVSAAQVKNQLDALRTTLRAEESSTLRLEKDLRQIEVLAKDENQRTSVAEYKRNLTATDSQAAAQLTAFREFYDAGKSAFAQRLTGQGVLDADVAGVSPRVAMAIQHRMQSKHSSVDMQGAANVEHLSTVLDGNLKSEAQRLGRSLKQSEVDQIALETVLTDSLGKGRSPKDLADMPIAPLKDAQGNILRTGGEFWESAYTHQLDQAYKDPKTFAGIKDTDQAVVKQTIDALAKDTGGLMPFELQPRLKEMVKAGKLNETQSAKVAEIWGKTFLAEPFQAGTLLHGVPDYQGVRQTVLLAGGDEVAAMRAYEATLGHHMAGFVAHGFAKAGVEPNFKALGKDSGGPLTTAMAKQLHDFYKSSIDLAGKWRPIIENAKPALTKAQRAEYFKDAQKVRTQIETMPEHVRAQLLADDAQQFTQVGMPKWLKMMNTIARPKNTGALVEAAYGAAKSYGEENWARGPEVGAHFETMTKDVASRLGMTLVKDDGEYASHFRPADPGEAAHTQLAGGLLADAELKSAYMRDRGLSQAPVKLTDKVAQDMVSWFRDRQPADLNALDRLTKMSDADVFSTRALIETDAMIAKGIGDEIPKRSKVEGITMTIDGLKTKSLDDGLSYRKNADGSVTVAVSAADVAHFIRPGTALDMTGRKQGEMFLPDGLRKDLFSLNLGEPRLVKTTEMTFDTAGNLLKVDFSRKVFENNNRLDPEGAQRLRDGSGTDELSGALKGLCALASKVKSTDTGKPAGELGVKGMLDVFLSKSSKEVGSALVAGGYATTFKNKASKKATAVVSAESTGHAAHGGADYARWTDPIRDYNDLDVHRAMDRLIDGQAPLSGRAADIAGRMRDVQLSRGNRELVLRKVWQKVQGDEALKGLYLRAQGLDALPKLKDVNAESMSRWFVRELQTRPELGVGVLDADPTLAKLYLESRGLDKLPAEISVERGRDLRDWFRDSLLPGKSGMDTLSLVQRQGQAALKLKDKLVESVPGLNAQRIDAVLKRHFTDPGSKDAVTIELVSKLSGTNAEAVKKFFAQPENRLLLEKPAEFDVVPATRLKDLPEVKTSRASLDDMLKTIWSKPDAAWDKNSIYRLYNRASEANPLKILRPEAYALRLGDIASARPADAISNVQSGFRATEYNGISQALAAAKNGDVDVARLHRTFFRFERANWQPQTIRERVYINARADHAPEVMDFVVKEIIDNPDKFPGVEMAKISGAAAVSGRSENIVIYTSGDEATTRVLDAIATYSESKPNHFMKSTPMLTDGKALGVATGAEPGGDLGRHYSFGSLRAAAISKALAEAKHRGASEAEFTSLVEKNLRALGVDPEAPHRNLRGSGD